MAVSHAKHEMARLLKRKRAFLVRMLCLAGLVFLPCMVLVLFSAIPWAFTYLFIGELIGASSFLEYIVLFLLVGAVSSLSILASMKLMKNRTRKVFILSLIISLLTLFLLTSSFSLVFMPQVTQAGNKINTFVAENRNLSFQSYVANLTAFLNNNIRAACDKPEASFAINRLVCYTLLDPYVMRIWNVTAADLIVYQGWGSCGEAAILIEELLHGAGYETRLAHFKGIDHEWAEAKYSGTWVIVDPWYIGNFVEAQELKNAKPEFQQASGVEVQYRNGTISDSSHEHGY